TVPKKNIRKILGKPLIAYTIEQAKQSNTLTRVIVSTEADEIMRVAKSFDCEVPFKRPMELATDDVPVLPYVVRHAIKVLKERENYTPDIVVVLQPTCPLRKANEIDEAVNKLIRTGADMVVSLCEVKNHPLRMWKLDGDKVSPFVRSDAIYAQRQDFPKLYRITGSIYAFWTKTIFKDNFFEGDVRGIIFDELSSIDIDTELDLLFVEFILTKMHKA
ncbi:acylneuraminate cytidylyltransferase family protein, partial [Candidatus Bathyarchaeota archaeon]|nr:acylneuraminate cytidylyltransferase family protein [Candidatus Bathyarchaeota archaeon]